MILLGCEQNRVCCLTLCSTCCLVSAYHSSTDYGTFISDSDKCFCSSDCLSSGPTRPTGRRRPTLVFRLFVCLSLILKLTLCLSLSLSTSLSVCLYLSLYLCCCQAILLSFCVYFCLSVCKFVCLFVDLCVPMYGCLYVL